MICRLFGIYTITALFELSNLVFAASTDRCVVCRALYRDVPYYRSGTVIWQKRPTPRIERHFRGTKPFQKFTKLRPIIVINGRNGSFFNVAGYLYVSEESRDLYYIKYIGETGAG